MSDDEQNPTGAGKLENETDLEYVEQSADADDERTTDYDNTSHLEQIYRNPTNDQLVTPVSPDLDDWTQQNNDAFAPKTANASGDGDELRVSNDFTDSPVYIDEATGLLYKWDAEQEEWVYLDEDDTAYFDGNELLDDTEQVLEGEDEDEDTLHQDSMDPNTEPIEDNTEIEVVPPKPKNQVNEMSKRSFRWFQRRILADRIHLSDENMRRKRLLEKCQMVRKVSKPVLTLAGASKPIITLLGVSKQFRTVDHQAHGEDSDESLAEEVSVSKTFREYSEKEWAMKNTIDFLGTAGCETSSSQTYRSSLRAVREQTQDFRLAVYEKQLQRRRFAIGHHKQAPQITAALRRHAERAIWRAVIDNTKPRYPLPRFILPRHCYLKKVQAQFIGPGSYEHDVFDSLHKSRQMRLPSTWATCTARFPKDKAEQSSKEGAGTCYLLDPWETLDKANEKHRHPGTSVPFESTPKNWRRGHESGSRIPPNFYNIKSPMEEFVTKKTSLRGPYDCYTPSRGVIPYGYHKTSNAAEKSRLGPGSYEIRFSLVKEMEDSYNSFKGVIPKADREKMFGFKAAFDKPLWPKENHIPPVGHYNPEMDLIGSDKAQYMAPFQVQAGLNKKETRHELMASDYYYFGNATWTQPPKGSDLGSVFKSNSPQIMVPKVHMIRKERNRAMNMYCDLEGGIRKETHYALDEPMNNMYALEDCQNECLKPKDGPVLDPYAIPGYGVDTSIAGTLTCGAGKCCGS